MRKLATIRQVKEILPIADADAIVLIKIDGGNCVALKHEFAAGDRCVYFEIDSFIPLCPQVEHIRARAYKRMGEKEGVRIKTIKLRGVISQGLALPLSKFPAAMSAFNDAVHDIQDGYFDVSGILGVEKYEVPVPASLNGQVFGNFPTCIKKTDQERCQNLGADIFVKNQDSRYEVTMKLDGTSFTAFYINGDSGVCGRNWQLQINEENQHNSLIRMYVDSGLQQVLSKFGRNFALQGELMGPAIKKNREGLSAHKLFIFDIYDIDRGCYLTPVDRHSVMAELWHLGLKKNMVQHVPVLHTDTTLDSLDIHTVDELLRFAEGASINHPVREGLVFKRVDGAFSFKAISNIFLLKFED
jgi:RNA ligase (TIGR02306 family)